MIIPTLQRSKALHGLVDQCAPDPRVLEVLVINNAQAPLSWNSPKVRVLQQEQNLGVNPAWNLGAREARGDLLAILNDDIVIPDSMLATVARSLRLPGIGILGVHPSCYERPRSKPDRPIIRPIYHRPRTFGTAVFMRRDRYVAIPEELVIYFGDDWLFYRQTHRCFAITGISMESDHFTTSGEPRFLSRMDSERAIYDRLQADWVEPVRRERELVALARSMFTRFLRR